MNVSQLLNRFRRRPAYTIRRAPAVKRPQTQTPLSATLATGLSGILIGTAAYALATNPSTTTGDYSAVLAYLLVYASIYMAAAIVILAIKNVVFPRLKPAYDLLILAGTLMGAEMLSMLFAPQTFILSLGMLISFVLLIAGKTLFKNYSYAGLNFYLATFIGIATGLAWGIEFFLSLPVSGMTKALFLSSTPLLLITLPSDTAQLFELYDILCREKWQRPRQANPQRIHSHRPMVSLHVPTYSEPPEIVIETLDQLARLQYDNFEVIVIDNNTADPALWEPVQAHCAMLGPNFRFMHVDNLPGAKGGALNYALEHTDPNATIVGVIDADYHAHPTFLKALVGHFDNSSVGFVQTPHDYRGWKDNLFLRMCYWEYKIFFHSAMVSLNERGAGITVGTMCLIRKAALQAAGGWSTWCVTEDSELAIRIHDVGYSSVYIDQSYGRGLIPDSFEGYKKQRYRWTAGPVQEWQYYAKHFIGLSKKSSALTPIQRIYHFNHGFDNVLLAFNIPLMILALALVTSMIVHNEIVAVPFELWLVATVTFCATPLLTILMYKATIKPKLLEIIGQLIAAKALSHVIFHSALRTTLTGNAAWNRTSKFKSSQSYSGALLDTKEEITIGLLLSVFVTVAYAAFPFTGMSLMLLIGISYIALGYFAAPFMALLGVWSLRRTNNQEETTEDTENTYSYHAPAPMLSTATVEEY